MTTSTIEAILDEIGPPGSEARLEAIADMQLGERSDAAMRVLESRRKRRLLIEAGFTAEQARFMVREINLNNNCKC